MTPNSMTTAQAVITAARVSAAAHVRARRVTPPSYDGDLDHKIRTAETSARAARMQAQLAEQRAARRSGPAACANGCRGACHQGRSVCEYAAAAFEHRTHRVIEWPTTEPMGYESAPVAVVRRTAAEVYRSAEVQRARRHIHLQDCAYWIGSVLALLAAAYLVIFQ